jgi:hypothetical protein
MRFCPSATARTAAARVASGTPFEKNPRAPALCARARCVVVSVHRNHNGSGLLAHHRDGVDAVSAGHLDVDDRDFGGLVLQAVLQVGSGVDHTHHPGVGKAVEGLAEAVGEELVVVGDHDPDHRDPHSTVTAVPTPALTRI